MAENVGAVERRARLVAGAILVLIGLALSGWAGWMSGLAGLALTVTAAVRY